MIREQHNKRKGKNSALIISKFIPLILVIYLFASRNVAYANESDSVLIHRNSKAALAIKHIEQAKKLLKEVGVNSQIKTLSMIQRNLTRNYIVLNLYTVDMESEIEKYLGESINVSIGDNSSFITVKTKKEKKEKNLKKTKSNDNIQELKELTRSLRKNGKRK